MEFWVKDSYVGKLNRMIFKKESFYGEPQPLNFTGIWRACCKEGV